MDKGDIKVKKGGGGWIRVKKGGGGWVTVTGGIYNGKKISITMKIHVYDTNHTLVRWIMYNRVNECIYLFISISNGRMLRQI